MFAFCFQFANESGFINVSVTFADYTFEIAQTVRDFLLHVATHIIHDKALV